MNTTAKRASTLRASLSRPSNFATTMTPRTGRITAVIRKAAMAKGIFSPAFCPRNGGKIRFPAPKNRENSIKLIQDHFFLTQFHNISSWILISAHGALFHETGKNSALAGFSACGGSHLRRNSIPPQCDSARSAFLFDRNFLSNKKSRPHKGRL